MSPFKKPLSLSTHFVSKALEEVAAEIAITTLNVAKTSATMQATLSQEGRVRCVMVGTFGRLREDGFTHDASNTCGPQLPPPDQCLDATSILVKHMGDKLRIASRVQFLSPRLDLFLKWAHRALSRICKGGCDSQTAAPTTCRPRCSS